MNVRVVYAQTECEMGHLLIWASLQNPHCHGYPCCHPRMLCYRRLRLTGRCWAWGLAPSWPEQGQDSFSPTLLINGTLIQGCITPCCSLCSHAQPLFHTALGRTVSNAILLIQCLMIVLALVMCGYILSALTFCLQSAAVTRYVLISGPLSLSPSLPTHPALMYMPPSSLTLHSL